MADFETFNLIFKADSTQLKKEVDDVKKKTTETTDTFKKAEDQTKKTDNEFSNLAKSLAKVATAYFSVGSVVAGFRTSMAHTTELGQFSKELDVNIETLDAWGKAVKNSGCTAEGFMGSLRSLSTTFNGSGQATLNYLLQLSDVLHELEVQGSPTTAQRYGESLNIDPGTVAFLRQGRTAVKAELEAQLEIGVVTANDAKAQQVFNKSLGQLADSLDQLFRTLNEVNLPVLKSFVDTITLLVQAFNKLSSSPSQKALSQTPDIAKFIFREFVWGNGFKNLNEGIDNTFINEHQSLKIPAAIAPVTNTQARNFHVDTINVNSASQDPGAVADNVVSRFEQQLQQSNSFFDNAVVV